MPEKSERDWKALIDEIRSGAPSGQEKLYSCLSSGARLFLQRRLGTPEVNDRLHDLFLIVVEAIRRGEIREPERLMGFVRTVLYRQLHHEISRLVHDRESTSDAGLADQVGAEPDPEQQAIAEEKLSLMRQLLGELKDRDYEVLMRCYIREQPPEQIIAEMRLTTAQFQLIKSRAKARLAELMRRRLTRRINPR
jgi:RNA polymerase sigma-70 factor (ECF subfamily)